MKDSNTPLPPAPPVVPEAVVEGPVSTEEFLQMKKKVSTLEFQVQQLLNINQVLKRERDDQRGLVQSLTKEISILRKQAQNQQIFQATIPNGFNQDTGEENIQPSTPRAGTRPQSMFEPREREQERLSQKSQSKDSLPSALSVSNIHVTDDAEQSNRVQSSSSGSGGEDLQRPCEPDLSHYDCPSSLPVDNSAINQSHSNQVLDGSSEYGYHAAPSAVLSKEDIIDDDLPSQEEVMKKTEKITKNIQELYKSGQDGKHDSFSQCADKIYDAVFEMAALFPKNPRIESVRGALHLLTSSAIRLQEECGDGIMGDLDPELDLPFKTQQVMQCAFDIARAAKQLVTLFQ